MTHHFYSLEDAARISGVPSQTFKGLALTGLVNVWVCVHELLADIDPSSPLPDALDDANGYTEWKKRKPLYANNDSYVINGWIILDASSVRQLLTQGEFDIRFRWVWVPEKSWPTYPLWIAEGVGPGERHSHHVRLENAFFEPLPVRPRASAGIDATKENSTLPSPVSKRGIRSQRERNLLRVIRGLWELSDLPKKPNVAADKLSALFDIWGWDGPGKSTIADTILKPAIDLDASKPRTGSS